MIKIRQTRPYLGRRDPHIRAKRYERIRKAKGFPDLNLLIPEIVGLMGDSAAGYMLNIDLMPEPPKAKKPKGILLTEPWKIRFTGVGKNRGLCINTQDFALTQALIRHIADVEHLDNPKDVAQKHVFEVN